MANRRCLKTLILHLHKSTHNPSSSTFLHHFRTLTHIPNRLPNLYPSNPNFTNPISISSVDSNHRFFSSSRVDNGNDESEEEDDEDDESDYEEEGENVEDGGLKREYSPEEKETEAAAIGYKVLGQLQRSDRVFKPYEPVFAVIQIGAHQFKVSNGDCIYTEKLKFCEVHDKLILNKVLMLGSKTQTMIGRPILPEAAVHAVVEEHALDAKVIIFKKKRRKNYRRKKGHRQELTKLRITDIQGIEKPETPVPTKTEKSAAKKVEKAPVAA
uniref:50S ribosomal protein L21, mitochondrial n=1 Tax=Erigeron canadensis TaxID=72917 RepID=UPI001CB92F31|nr:50S ribosomal protein L21, mitochondrial [Erigeron canadensis]